MKFSMKPSRLPKRQMDEELDEDFEVPAGQLQMYGKTKTIRSVDAYLDEPIGALNYYRTLIYYLHNMEPEDELRIWIDNYGGSLDSALAIIDAMKNSEGKVQVIVSGNAASAASLIALSADNLIVGDNSRFMCHAASYSSGFSKQGDIEAMVQYSAKMLREVTQKAYEGFMTQEELEQMWMGKDFWMDCAEVVQRLQNRQNYLNKKFKAPSVKKPRKPKSKNILEPEPNE